MGSKTSNLLIHCMRIRYMDLYDNFTLRLTLQNLYLLSLVLSKYTYLSLQAPLKATSQVSMEIKHIRIDDF